jgi:hypothetical protein
MTREQVYERLCYHDTRNPHYDTENVTLNVRNECTCDNCFRGKDELALEVLRLMDEADEHHAECHYEG